MSFPSESHPHIRIPTPCHENWEQMTPSERGRFCQACKKEVRDFTQSSLAEVFKTVESTQGPQCGRFHARQLEPPKIVSLQPTRALRGWQKWMVAALTIMGMHSVAAQVTEMPADTYRSEVVQEKGYLSGVIRGHRYQKPLEGASVTLVNEKGVIAGVYTDSTGSFRIAIPETLEASPMLSLRFRYMDGLYAISNLPAEGQHFDIELNEVIWMEEVVITSEKEYVTGSTVVGGYFIDGKRQMGLTYYPGSMYGYDDLNDLIFMRTGQAIPDRHEE